MVGGGSADSALGERNGHTVAVRVRQFEDVECLIARVPALITV